jgi:PAS domain S-box-containing protein
VSSGSAVEASAKPLYVPSRISGHERIVFRILVPLILAIAVLLFSFIFAVRTAEKKKSALETAQSSQEVQKWLRVVQEEKTALMGTTLQAIMNDDELARAFRNRDTAALLERAKPLFDALRRQHGVTHFYFHLPDRTVLLRVHSPELHGDKIDRYTMLAAERTGRLASGIEHGQTGAFTLRVVSPWRVNGELIGYLELGVEFENIVETVQRVLSKDVNFVVAVQKKFIGRAQWEAAMKAQARPADWNEFPEIVIMNKTIPVLPRPVIAHLSDFRDDLALTNRPGLSTGDDLQLAFLPLVDIAGNTIGETIVVQDLKESASQTRASIRLIALVCAAISLTLVGFFYLFLRRIERTLTEQTEKLQAEICERHSAEEALTRLSEQHAVILNSIGAGVHGIGLDGRITFENPAAAAMFGREMIELVGQPAHATIHHSHADGSAYSVHDCPIHATLRDGQVRRVRGEVFWRRDGTSFPVDYTATPTRDKNGQIIGTTVVFMDVTERQRVEEEIKKINARLLVASREAGRAEVATGVLHNVGNVLNSVNISAALLADQIKKTKSVFVSRVADLMKQRSADLGEFLTRDPRGKLLPGYMADLAAQLAAERALALEELTGLHKNIEHIKDIVTMQQSYAKAAGVMQSVKTTELIEDAVRMTESGRVRHDIELLRDFDEALPEIVVDRHKVLQILVNLIRNAEHACGESGSDEKHIILQVRKTDQEIVISVIDNGVGIPAENLTRIFNHGFTTRKNGHGFGLHSSALTARELNASLTVHSEGPGMGAAFTLKLPRTVKATTESIPIA